MSNFWNKAGRIAAGIGTGGISELANYMHGGKIFGGGRDQPDPYNEANKYLDQVPGISKQYYDPYVQQGKSAYDQLNPIYSQMTNDPTGYMNKLMEGYTASPAYEYQKREMQKEAGNTAAAGGTRGNIQDITNQSGIVNALLNQDMQQWLQNVSGAQNQGMQGLGHFYDTGYDASKSLSGDLSNLMGTKAQMGYQSAANKIQSKQDLQSALLKLFGSLGGAAIGGFMGGSPGAATGSGIGQSVAGLGMSPAVSNYQPFSNPGQFLPMNRPGGNLHL